MENRYNVNLIKDTILDILDCVDGAREILKKEKNNEYQSGRLMGFCEALEILKTNFTGEDELMELIPFDVEARCMSDYDNQ